MMRPFRYREYDPAEEPVNCPECGGEHAISDCVCPHCGTDHTKND